MIGQIAIKCAAVDLTKPEGLEALRRDVLAAARAINGILQLPVIQSSNWAVTCQVAGVADIYAVSKTATSNSGHVIRVLRNGQFESNIQFDCSLAEIVANEAFYLGSITVGAGDKVELQVLIDDSLAPEISVADMSIQITIKPE